jgi:hypothetical protein
MFSPEAVSQVNSIGVGTMRGASLHRGLNGPFLCPLQEVIFFKFVIRLIKTLVIVSSHGAQSF